MEVLLSSEGLTALFTLTLMEVILGIDNIVFITIISGKLPKNQQKKAQNWGLILAIIPRVILLLLITEIMKLTTPVINIAWFDVHLSWKDLIVLVGGLFLLYKSTSEIHHKLEGSDENVAAGKANSFQTALFQIVIINIVFSFDSILTAVGLAESILIMVIAVLASSAIMMAFASPVSDFVNRHPTVKMLALSFLLLIGFLLVTESFHVEVPKGYIYFAMAFSLAVEMLNLRMRSKSKPVKLKNPYD